MRVRPRGLVLLLAAILLPAAACAQQDAGSAEDAFREGRYEEAIRIGTSVVESDPSDEGARRALVGALLDVGRYEEAEAAAGDLHNLRGEALRARGQLGEAEAAFRQAIDAGGADPWTAEMNLAEMTYQRGDREEAIARFDAFISLYNQSTTLNADDLTAVGNAVWYLGNTEPELFQDALMAFDEATKAAPESIDAHIRIAELFVEKYNSTEAYAALRDALAINPNHPRALLAQARARAFDGERGDALELVDQALEINPNLVPARVFRSRMLLDTEDIDTAEAEVRLALQINPRSLEALSMLAAIHHLRGDQSEYERVVAEVNSLNPRYAGLHTTVAEISAQVRRYAEAADLAREATIVDPESWPAFGLLGLNEFRLGRVDEARAALELAFAGDPYNVWIKNNLDLLDTFAQYEIREAPGLRFMLHEDEAELLQPYLMEAATEAHAVLTQRYGDTPRGPVRIELYPRSADFSVRTVGLAGMGALGVSFGDVVALDSPSAREAGRYNWVTTLWHELAHTIALGVSNSRVPRWLTEGLSTLEERRARPGWAAVITPEFILMYDSGELPPPSRLNEGFIRPASPQHLGGAYDLASLVAQWLEETRGFDVILRMLRAYGEGMSDAQIVTDILRTTPEALDADFDRWMRETHSPDDARQFMQLLAAGQRLIQEGNMAAAKSVLQEAGTLFPVAGAGSPFALLAQIHQGAGDTDEAIEALRTLTRFDETGYAPNLLLAELLEAEGDDAGAAEALERAVWIHPYEPAPHLKLAELYTALGEHERAVRERRAVVGLRPSDLADAYYRLAVALLAAGDFAGARQEVLRALELAPSFGEAQDLLLEIHER